MYTERYLEGNLEFLKPNCSSHLIRCQLNVKQKR